jgi:4-amino-4-deoxy-L-arabinose transferase-like glycosyltransferase
MSSTIVSSAKWLPQQWLNNRSFAIWTASILAVLVRLAVSFALKTYRFYPGDDHFAFGYEWGQIARWLVERGMFSLDGKVPTSDTDPLYVFIIAPFFQAFGTFSTTAAIALIILQSVLCGLSTWALFVLAEKLYGPIEARLSALLFAFYPASIAFAVGRIGPSSLSILLICLIFIAVLDLPKSARPLLAVTAGFLMGLLVLATAHVLTLLLVVPLWLLLLGKGQRLRMLFMSLIFVGMAIVVTLPWSIRNSIAVGHTTISKANLGYHVWVGNNPGATGYMRTTELPDDEFYNKYGREPNYVRMAASWAVENPQDFLILTLKRIEYFWYKIPEENRQHNSAGYLLSIWSFVAILALAVLGVCWRGEKFEKISLLLLFFGIYPLLFYLTHVTHYRHRFHIEPFMLVLASYGLHRLWLMRLSVKAAPIQSRVHMQEPVQKGGAH